MDESRTIENKGGVPKRPSKESIMESMAVATREMVTIGALKEAITGYLLLDDIYEYEDNTASFCLILGRLEMSLIKREQSLNEDKKALLELSDE